MQTNNKYYDVKVECLVPATLIYKVYSESPEKACEMISSHAPQTVKYKLSGKQQLKITVYEAGCCMIKFMKNIFRG
jgi:hypothetical protein